jgi:thioredoxin-like negative regulator of GroEL
MVAPIVEKLAAEYDGRIIFSKLNVDQAQSIATRYGIRSIPTLLFFKEGKPMRQFVGFMAEKELRKNLDEALAS